MASTGYTIPIEQAKRFFDKTTGVFTEADSDYAPVIEQFSVAQQVAHVAQTIDWFMSGGFSDAGFDLDFAAHQEAVRACTSLAAARAWLGHSLAAAVATLSTQTADSMMSPLPAGPIMGGEPRAAVVGAICEHTAHHRGALAVYARLCGKTPPMPYGD